ncbi:tyrosine-protein phosphatase [Anaerotalea alkaliphila]|uniref:protein-tyrosine-phosphatase n=1 Tax=Anaerotalea alkaliphila TaxID=2662126 RepID=A0A7X5HWI2_9FIRM|nr:CpsB/CapC family capsule biosynthesis tyrosine phosphatase [Anaerotalea alkaliphila]NDL67965.1 hypothetical protein [Anaerotalea alkaliphila]
MKFVDVHNHTLLGVDDGPQSMAAAMEMVAHAYGEGVRQIILTPHYRPEIFPVRERALQERFQELRTAVGNSHPDLQLHLGHEAHFSHDLLDALDAGECKTLAGSRVVLLELPAFWNPQTMERFFFDGEARGYKFLIAHVERVEKLMQDSALMGDWLDRGVLFQVNASSITNGRPKAQRILRRLIMTGCIHVVATDAHSMGRRRPDMAQAYGLVERWAPGSGESLFYGNGLKIIENKQVEKREPCIGENHWFQRLKGVTKWNMNLKK